MKWPLPPTKTLCVEFSQFRKRVQELGVRDGKRRINFNYWSKDLRMELFLVLCRHSGLARKTRLINDIQGRGLLAHSYCEFLFGMVRVFPFTPLILSCSDTTWVSHNQGILPPPGVNINPPPPTGYRLRPTDCPHFRRRSQVSGPHVTCTSV